MSLQNWCIVLSVGIIGTSLRAAEAAEPSIANQSLPTITRVSSIEDMRYLVEQVASSTYIVDDNGTTPLMYAAVHGNVGLCAGLLEKGADVDATDFFGRTALMLVARSPLEEMTAQEQVEVCLLLLQHGASIEAKDSLHRSVLMQAATYGHGHVCRLLIAREAENFAKITMLMCSAMEGDVSECERLLEKGARVESIDGRGWTPLMYAVKNGHTAVSKLLLKESAQVNFKDHLGKTPLMIAIENDLPDVAKLLLDRDDTESH